MIMYQALRVDVLGLALDLSHPWRHPREPLPKLPLSVHLRCWAAWSLSKRERGLLKVLRADLLCPRLRRRALGLRLRVGTMDHLLRVRALLTEDALLRLLLARLRLLQLLLARLRLLRLLLEDKKKPSLLLTSRHVLCHVSIQSSLPRVMKHLLPAKCQDQRAADVSPTSHRWNAAPATKAIQRPSPTAALIPVSPDRKAHADCARPASALPARNARRSCALWLLNVLASNGCSNALRRPAPRVRSCTPGGTVRSLTSK